MKRLLACFAVVLVCLAAEFGLMVLAIRFEREHSLALSAGLLLCGVVAIFAISLSHEGSDFS